MIRIKVLSLQRKGRDMDKNELKKKLAEIYQEGYDAGEADMMKSMLEVIQAHENDDPKQVLAGIIFTCMKTIKDREEKGK